MSTDQRPKMTTEKEVADLSDPDSGSGPDKGLPTPDASGPQQEKQEVSVRLVLLFASMAVAVFCGALVRICPRAVASQTGNGLRRTKC